MKRWKAREDHILQPILRKKEMLDTIVSVFQAFGLNFK